MLYLPGAKYCAPDAVSHNPIGDPKFVLLVDDVASVSQKVNDTHTMNLPSLIYFKRHPNIGWSTRVRVQLLIICAYSMGNLQCVPWDKSGTSTSSDEAS